MVMPSTIYLYLFIKIFLTDPELLFQDHLPHSRMDLSAPL